jgi:hypothetical protein
VATRRELERRAAVRKLIEAGDPEPFGDFRDQLVGARGQTGDSGVRGRGGPPGASGAVGATGAAGAAGAAGTAGLDKPLNRYISTLTWPAIGDAIAALDLVAPVSTAWGTADMLLAFPFAVDETWIVSHFWWINGTVLQNNIDCAIYDANGDLAAGKNGTNAVGASTFQRTALAAPVNLAPGKYQCAINHANAAGTFLCHTFGSVATAIAAGVRMQLNANPPPAAAVLVDTTQTFVPVFGVGYFQV